MKNNNTIKIKNALPELLETVCNHKDCPDWLKEGIWDLFVAQTGAVTFSADHWRDELASIALKEKREREEDALNAEVIER